jgi:hypothetical protein
MQSASRFFKRRSDLGRGGRNKRRMTMMFSYIFFRIFSQGNCCDEISIFWVRCRQIARSARRGWLVLSADESYA